MVPSKSAKTCNAIELYSNQDLITNLPDIAIDKILKRLPIKMLAKMSILSTKWRHIWLSLKYLVFDKIFWDKLKYDDNNYETKIRRYNSIISNILFHHVGPLHQFHLHIPHRWDDYFYSGWLSSLSKVGVKKISISKWTDDSWSMPSSFFDCKDLVKLTIQASILNRAPRHFKGFAYLRTLELIFVEFKHDVFRSLIEKCPQLVVLKLEQWTGINELVIDAPKLEHLTIEGEFKTIVFKNVERLSFLSIFNGMENIFVKARGVDRSIEMLASSCQLQELHLGGQMCKYFGAGCITMLHTLKFLHSLRLTEVDLSDFDEFCFTLGMVQRCPFIEDLVILVHPQKCDIEHEFDYNKNCELRHLVKVKIIDLIGSRPELKLIEYLFSVASKLETLAFRCYYKLDPISELKVTRELSEFPRASSKAKLVCG